MMIKLQGKSVAIIACWLGLAVSIGSAADKQSALSPLQQEAADAVTKAIRSNGEVIPAPGQQLSYTITPVPGTAWMLVEVFLGRDESGLMRARDDVWAWRRGDHPRLVASGADDIFCPETLDTNAGMIIDTKELDAIITSVIPAKTIDYLTLRLRLKRLFPKNLAFGEWPRWIIDFEDTARVSQVVSPTALEKIREVLKTSPVVSKNPADRCMLLWGQGPGKYVPAWVACFRAVGPATDTWSRPVTMSMFISRDKVFPCGEGERLNPAPLEDPAGKP